VLIAAARAARWLIDRQRLKDWEANWACVGPQWTRHG
jgi:hypothetical protein